MIFPKFTQSVGVAPGTTTMQLGEAIPERSGFYPLSPWGDYNRYTNSPVNLGAFDQTRIRWDIIAIVGGGSLAIALAIGLVASALSK